MIRKLLAVVGASGCALGMAMIAPASANAADSWSFQTALNPIVANKVTGTGASWITITGTTAEVKIQVNGLLNGSPHAQHIHIDAQGQCPTAPQQHNGLPSITVADGAPFYGTIGTSLTNDGDTSPAAALAVTQYPTAGSYTYARTIQVDPSVVANLQKGTAVLVVHGIDYNGNGSYDNVLGASELDASLPAEATDPALCGKYEPMQMAAVPDGAADTGGGSTAISGTGSQTGIAIGAAGLLAVAGAATISAFRRRSEQD